MDYQLKEYKGITYLINDYNCSIQNSYLIRSWKLMKDFCEHVLTEPPFNKRSINSYIAEWRTHNLLYRFGLFKKSTVNSDLNINESKKRRFWYRILSIFYI